MRKVSVLALLVCSLAYFSPPQAETIEDPFVGILDSREVEEYFDARIPVGMPRQEFLEFVETVPETWRVFNRGANSYRISFLNEVIPKGAEGKHVVAVSFAEVITDSNGRTTEIIHTEQVQRVGYEVPTGPVFGGPVQWIKIWYCTKIATCEE